MKYIILFENFTGFENIAAWQSKNFYERLGISTSATIDDIRKAFRTLSLKYHPDKYTDPKIIENYQEIQKLLSEAKTILLDPTKKALYDAKLNINQKKYTWEEDRFNKKYDWEKDAEERYARYEKEKEREKTKQKPPPINKEKLTKDFISCVGNNIYLNYGINIILMELHKLENLGLNKRELILAASKITNNFIKSYTQDNIYRNYGINAISSKMHELIKLGIDKYTISTLIYPIIEKYFISYAQDNIHTTYGSSVIYYKLKEIRILDISLNNENMFNKLKDRIQVILLKYFTNYCDDVHYTTYGINNIQNKIEELSPLIDKNKLSAAIKNKPYFSKINFNI